METTMTASAIFTEGMSLLVDLLPYITAAVVLGLVWKLGPYIKHLVSKR